MKVDLAFEDLSRATSQCLRCLACTYGEWPENYPICPIYQYHRVFTASPGGIIYLLKALLEKRIDYTETISEFAYQCTLCEKCDICEILPIAPPNVTPTDLIRFLRYQLVKRGMIPEELSELYEEIKKDSDRLRNKGEMSLPQIERDNTIDTVLFVENSDHITAQETYQSAIRLLEKIGEPVALFSGETSLYELYDLGFWDELNVAIKRKEKETGKLEGKKVIFLDPHCQEFMVKRYPEIASQSPTIEAMHMSEVLLEAVKAGKLKERKEKIKVAYHDPCHLSRGLGIHDVPRELLNSQGVELVEMRRSGSDTYCCGAGCKNISFPKFSNWVTGERIKEFKETEAELLITSCPHCKSQFRKFLPNDEKDLVLDLVEFVEQRTR